jgi:hypothetical protein
MHGRSCPVRVIGKNSLEITSQDFAETCRNLSGSGVEDSRRKVAELSITGKKIGTEEKAEFSAIIPHVPRGVAGKMDGAQAVPNRDFIAIVKKAIRAERAESQYGFAEAFQQSANLRPALIDRRSRIMRRIQRRSGNPRSMFVGEPGNIENMIEVAVGDEDSANRLMILSRPRRNVRIDTLS